MSFISKSIANLVDGVSEQPSSARLRTQAEAQVNFVSSVVKGLIRRQPTQFVEELLATAPADVLVHWINRDAAERYVVLVYPNSTIKVFDLDGVEKTVTNNAAAYINTATPSTSLRALTVADFTFIANNEKIVAMEADLSVGGISQGALVFVSQANYETTYTVNVDGVEKATFTTAATGALSTDAIATDLATDLAANLGGWTVNRVGHVIQVINVGAADFDIQAIDSRANTQMKAVKTTVQRFSDLPTTAPHGFVVKVQGGSENNFDDFYVKFEANDPSATMDEGVWTETVAPGITYKLDADTMPHTLIRNMDGTFTFDNATWDDRDAGDEDTAPDPSFVGETINSIFFFENRLGFLADQYVTLSEESFFFNFWPTTVMTQIDSDRLDVAASDNAVSILHHAIPWNEKLLLMSEFSQFTLSAGGAGLSPRTAKIRPTTSYEVNVVAEPIGAGRMVYFAGLKGNNSAIREYFVSPDEVEVQEAPDITEHVPTFIPKNIVQLEAAVNTSFILALSSEDRSKLFAYNYFWRDNEKAQSSWHEWQFAGDVLGMKFFDDQLYLVIQHADDTVHLEKLSISVGTVDTGLTYVTHLDRRIDESQCVSVTYSAANDETTFTLPYDIGSETDWVIATRFDAGGRDPGQIVPTTSMSGTTIVVDGDKSEYKVYIGKKYGSRYRFSKQFVKEERADGEVSITDAGLVITLFTLSFEDTGYFLFRVVPDFGDTSTKIFTGKLVGHGSTIIGAVGLTTGSQRFMVGARNDKANMEIYTDSILPANFQSAVWAAKFSIKSSRISGA